MYYSLLEFINHRFHMIFHNSVKDENGENAYSLDLFQFFI